MAGRSINMDAPLLLYIFLHAYLIVYLCWLLWRGSAHSFPRGEAVMKIRSSERIFMTDEERRNVPNLYAAR